MEKRMNFDLWIGLLLIGLLLILLFIAATHLSYDPNAMVGKLKLANPSLEHVFGNDQLGRDIFSRIAQGTITTVTIALSTVVFGVIFGVFIGGLSGYFGRFVDEFIMRIIDALSAFPGILLALVLITIFGSSSYNIVIALGIIFIPSFARITRSGFIQYKEMEFVKSAQVAGAKPLRIMFIHILPNVYPSLVSAASIGFANAILSEAALSYLGLGVQPPNPSWGRMLSESQGYLFNAPWCAIAPGCAIILAVLAFNFLAEGLRKKYAL